MNAETTDAELLRRYVEERSEAAFADIVTRHLGLVYHAAARQLAGGTAEAGDVAQRVFLLLARRAPELCRHDSLAGWLHMTTRFVARETLRGAQRRRVREQEAMLMQQTEDDTSAQWERMRPALDEALAELHAGDREAVLLRYFAGLRLADVGTRLALSENAARMRVERALERLRRVLARRGIASTAAALTLALESHAHAAAPEGLGALVVKSALAGTSATAAGAVTAAGFMGTTKFAAGAGVALIAALATASFLYFERTAAEAQTAEARASHTALIEQTRQIDQRFASTSEALARLRQIATLASRPQDAGTAASASAAQKPLTPVGEGNAFMTRHPEVREALNAWADSIVNARYGALFAMLGLDEERRQRFRELTRSMAFVPNPGPDGKALQLNAGPKLRPAEIEARLRELLGPEGFRAYEEFDRTVRARDLVAELGASLALTDAPLAASQASELVALFNGVRVESKLHRFIQPIDWDAAAQQVGAVLRTEQLVAFEAMRAHERYSEAWRQRPNPFGPAAGGAK